MKRIIPIENVVFETQLSENEVVKILNENIEHRKFYIFRKSYSKPYIGKIIGNTFQIERVINYRNSFLPKIKGEVIPKINGTKIVVKMQLHLFTSVFMTLWFSFIFMMLINIILKGASFEVLVPIVMLVLGIALVYFGFNREASRTKKDFQEIFKAKIISE